MEQLRSAVVELMKILAEWLAALGMVFTFGYNCGDDA